MNQLRPDQPSSHSEKELAYALLVLERQLNAYQRLHQEDLVALRSALEELKGQIVALQTSTEQRDPTSVAQDAGASVS